MTYSAEIVHANTGKPLRLRSAATTGKRLFTLGGKASSSWGLRMADLVDLHAADLGGPEHLSESELSLFAAQVRWNASSKCSRPNSPRSRPTNGN